MDKRKLTLSLYRGFWASFFVALFATSSSALATDDQYYVLLPNELNKPLEIEPFSYKEEVHIEPSLLISAPSKGADKKYSFQSKKDEDIEDQILAIVPQGQNMKKLWYIVDGETDLYFENLRADKSNKGVKYTMTSVPLLGDIDGTKFEFSAGDKMEFGFKSNQIPLIGEVEGFRLRGSVSENASISARYTMKFD